ncbi:MAG: DUF2497 domain-containing protein [Sphingomonadaceae bacterium]|nr:DUF2497 domain-containing protein [Sphingomonadaceae bacterium]
MRPAVEPTVEEILESIKQVIARDNRAGAADVRRQRETDGLPDDEGSEDTAADEDIAEDDVLDLSESAEYVVDEPAQDDPAENNEGGDEPLLNEQTQNGMRESLEALALLSKPGAQPQIVRSGETSLEGLVRELLRPALAEWLDKNLPPLVERMVSDEIRRISSKKG